MKALLLVCGLLGLAQHGASSLLRESKSEPTEACGIPCGRGVWEWKCECHRFKSCMEGIAEGGEGARFNVMHLHESVQQGDYGTCGTSGSGKSEARVRAYIEAVCGIEYVLKEGEQNCKELLTAFSYNTDHTHTLIAHTHTAMDALHQHPIMQLRSQAHALEAKMEKLTHFAQEDGMTLTQHLHAADKNTGGARGSAYEEVSKHIIHAFWKYVPGEKEREMYGKADIDRQIVLLEARQMEIQVLYPSHNAHTHASVEGEDLEEVEGREGEMESTRYVTGEVHEI
eukprot:GDKI01036062.1.p1 GENE.GDKI01036062.1~~GDKI01036062.1.p1  ORF type:complete len:284 (-),score=93.05 GDKI01036062.1:177-1028(-)